MTDLDSDRLEILFGLGLKFCSGWALKAGIIVISAFVILGSSEGYCFEGGSPNIKLIGMEYFERYEEYLPLKFRIIFAAVFFLILAIIDWRCGWVSAPRLDREH